MYPYTIDLYKVLEHLKPYLSTFLLQYYMNNLKRMKGMNMPLTELQSLIQGSHLPNYYEELLHHHKEIIASVKQHGQKNTAEILSIAVGKFNPLYKMILAYSMIVAKESTDEQS